MPAGSSAIGSTRDASTSARSAAHVQHRVLLLRRRRVKYCRWGAPRRSRTRRRLPGPAGAVRGHLVLRRARRPARATGRGARRWARPGVRAAPHEVEALGLRVRHRWVLGVARHAGLVGEASGRSTPWTPTTYYAPAARRARGAVRRRDRVLGLAGRGTRVVPESSVVAVLAALGVDATCELVERAGRGRRGAAPRRTLPPGGGASGETATSRRHRRRPGRPQDRARGRHPTRDRSGRTPGVPRTVDGVALGEVTFRSRPTCAAARLAPARRDHRVRTHDLPAGGDAAVDGAAEQVRTASAGAS